MNKALLDTDILSEITRGVNQTVAAHAGTYRKALNLAAGDVHNRDGHGIADDRGLIGATVYCDHSLPPYKAGGFLGGRGVILAGLAAHGSRDAKPQG